MGGLLSSRVETVAQGWGVWNMGGLLSSGLQDDTGDVAASEAVKTCGGDTGARGSDTHGEGGREGVKSRATAHPRGLLRHGSGGGGRHDTAAVDPLLQRRHQVYARCGRHRRVLRGTRHGQRLVRVPGAHTVVHLPPRGVYHATRAALRVEVQRALPVQPYTQKRVHLPQSNQTHTPSGRNYHRR